MTTDELVIDKLKNAKKLAVDAFQRAPRLFTSREYVSIALFGLVDAARTFDASKYNGEAGAIFWGFARHRIRGAILDEIDRYVGPRALRTRQFKREPIDQKPISNQSEARRALGKALAGVRQRERRIVVMSFMLEISHAKIAKVEGVNESRISQLIKVGLRDLKRELGRRGVYSVHDVL